MKKYRAYHQLAYGCEKFDITDKNEEIVIAEAETAEEAYEIFIEWVYENSLYGREETEEWLNENPLYVAEVE